MEIKYKEKSLEKSLREVTKKLGYLALKFSSSSYTGLPDRLIILPNRQVIWVELKSSDKTLSKEQNSRKRMLEKRGHLVYIVDDQKSLNLVLLKLKEVTL